MKGLGERTLSSVSKEKIGDPWKLGMVLGMSVLAVFIGVLIPMLGISTGLTVLLIVLVSSLAIALAVVLYFAACSRPWAISSYLFLVILVTDISLRPSGMETSSFDIQSMTKLVIWGGALVIALTNFSKVRVAVARAQPVLLLLYAIIAILSSLWSTTPWYSFGSGIVLLSVVVFCAVVAESLSPQQIINSILAAMTIFVMLSLLRYFYLAATGEFFGFENFRYSGFAGSVNNLGRIGGLLLLFLWLSHLYRSMSLRRGWVLTGLGLFALVTSQSRTAMVATFISFWPTLSGKMRVITLLLGSIILVIVMLLYGNKLIEPEQGAQFISRSGEVGEVTTLTGRTSIWSYAWEKYQQSPLLGHGYAATREFMPKEYFTVYGWTTNSAHNTVLQSLLTTGILGTSILLMLWCLQFRDFLFRRSPFRDSIFAIVIVSGLTEAGVVGLMPTVITVLWGLTLFWRDPSDLSANTTKSRKHRDTSFVPSRDNAGG